MAIGGGALVLLLAAGVAVLMKPSDTASNTVDSRFSISEYRHDASRLTGNTYRLSGRVENIETLGNDRLVAVSLPGNTSERLPLLVQAGVCGRINLTRGDSFVFEVICRNGKDAEGREVKGIMVVQKVETE